MTKPVAQNGPDYSRETKGMVIKMKKIAVLTLNGYFIYGNRLQNYATQEVLKPLRFEV